MAHKIKHALKKGTQIENYRIDKTLGGGGFSVVYLAVDLNNNEQVVIKEYFPGTISDRLKDNSVRCNSDEHSRYFTIGFKRFLEEAASLAKLQHPNIVRVHNFFRANNTVYMVMDYEYGKELRHYIRQHGGRLTEKFIRTVFPEVLHGLDELHRNHLLHLDIKPANIFLRPGGKPLLIDFGAARSVLEPAGTGPQTLTRGFAPIEQHQHKAVGPWSDIYALGASIYACMSGKAPPTATDRIIKDTLKPVSITNFGRNYSTQLLEAVDWCMQLHYADRPQSAHQLLEFLDSEYEEYTLRGKDSWYQKALGLLGNK